MGLPRRVPAGADLSGATGARCCVGSWGATQVFCVCRRCVAQRVTRALFVRPSASRFLSARQVAGRGAGV